MRCNIEVASDKELDLDSLDAGAGEIALLDLCISGVDVIRLAFDQMDFAGTSFNDFLQNFCKKVISQCMYCVNEMYL